MKPTVAILCGGGPVPDIYAVISTVAKVFMAADYRVLGIRFWEPLARAYVFNRLLQKQLNDIHCG